MLDTSQYKLGKPADAMQKAAGAHEHLPHRCPICLGTGRLPLLAQGSTTDNERPCHGCGGRGLVWG